MPTSSRPCLSASSTSASATTSGVTPSSAGTERSVPQARKLGSAGEDPITSLLNQFVAAKRDLDYVQSQVARYSTVADSLACSHHAIAQDKDRREEARRVCELMKQLDGVTDAWKAYHPPLKSRITKTARTLNAKGLCTEAQYEGALATSAPLTGLTDASDESLGKAELRTLPHATTIGPADIVQTVRLRDEGDHALLSQLIDEHKQLEDLQRTLTSNQEQEECMLEVLSTRETLRDDAPAWRKKLEAWRELIRSNERLRTDLKLLEKGLKLLEKGVKVDAPRDGEDERVRGQMRRVVLALETACGKYNAKYVVSDGSV